MSVECNIGRAIAQTVVLITKYTHSENWSNCLKYSQLSVFRFPCVYYAIECHTQLLTCFTTPHTTHTTRTRTHTHTHTHTHTQHTQVLKKYLLAVEDLESRLSLATYTMVYDVGIEVCI